MAEYSSKLGGCTSLSPAVSIAMGPSPFSVHTPSGNTTALNSGGITSEGSCNGSQAAPDETSGVLTLPNVTSSSGSSEAGEMHSENEERSMEEGERCITELTRGNRCIRGAPRATVQQLYGQTYDLEALALEIDRTSLDALDTGEIRRDYYPGVKFPVGDLGRKLLLIAVREKMEVREESSRTP